MACRRGDLGQVRNLPLGIGLVGDSARLLEAAHVEYNRSRQWIE